MNFLKGLFNFSRNLSLCLVILTIFLLYQLSNDKQFTQEFIEALENGERNEQQNFLDREDEEMMTMGFEEVPLLGEKGVKKVKIAVKNGTAYLRPSQIMYVESNKDKKELITVDENGFEIKESLSKIFDKLDADTNEHFFSTRFAILNCNYIQQLIQVRKDEKDGKVSYLYYAVMQDNEYISIAEKKHKKLKEVLNDLF